MYQKCLKVFIKIFKNIQFFHKILRDWENQKKISKNLSTCMESVFLELHHSHSSYDVPPIESEKKNMVLPYFLYEDRNFVR